jgi:origin recognition complex subunit 2
MTNLSEDRAFATNYFNFISNSLQCTASNSVKDDPNEQFAKSEIPEPAEQRELLKSFDQLKGHGSNLKNLAEINKSALIACSPHLRAGFNFLCYGFGRKQELLESVVPELFQDYNIFSLTGYSEDSLNLGPTALFNCLLNTIQMNLFPKLESFNTNSSASKTTILIKTDLICSQKFYQKNLLLLHQIDSPAFRSPVVFDCLLKFVACGHFSIIASVDNPGIVNLFSKSRFEKFNWLWMDCTTMQPYTEELNRFALDACSNSAAKQTPRAAIIVLQSLTSNSRSIFKLLAAHQLASSETQVANLIDSFEDEEDHQENQNTGTSSTLEGYNGMSYHGLFQKCQENFVVTAEANFRTQLTEFTDHDLFKSLEGRDGSVMFFIPFYHSELRQIIQDI